MKTEYEFLPELFLRAPYYSYNTYDPELLPEVLSDLAYRNALWLASPSFYSQLKNKDFDFGRFNDKEKLSLLKYYNRMCFRPTPFGSFASFSTGRWGNGDTTILAAGHSSTLHLLPDMQFLTNPYQTELPYADAQLMINPALYRLGHEYRFIKSLISSEGKYHFSLDALPAEPFNVRLLAQFKKGTRKTNLLLNWMCASSGCTAAEASDYLQFLIDSQVLISAARGRVLGVDGQPYENIKFEVAGFWNSIQKVPFTTTGYLADTAAILGKLISDESAKATGQYFYGALERKWERGGPDDLDKAELLESVHVMQRFSLAVVPAALRQFTEDFEKRFGLERVPLLKALDPDSGIIYSGLIALNGQNDLVEGIHFPGKETRSARLDWNSAHGLLFNSWALARQRGPYDPIVILPEDVKRLNDLPPSPPANTLAVMFRKTEDHLVIDYTGGVSAVSLIGRFSVFSDATYQLCRKLAAYEQTANPGIIFADIDQLSDLHADNINRRLEIYPFTLRFNTFCTISRAVTLKCNDLLLYVADGELRLFSKSLEQRVIPRLSTVYNYQLNSLTVFRLLCDMQYQGVQQLLTLDLERFFPALDFYPRVVTGQTILCPAKWKLGGAELKALQDSTAAEVMAQIRILRRQTGIPSKISMGAFDQQLIFDLSCVIEARFFVKCLKNLETAVIMEYLPPARVVKTANQPLAGQFIAFLQHSACVYSPEKSVKGLSYKGVTRNYFPGDEWLYLKLYCTPQTADDLLRKIIIPFVKRCSNSVASWFFIRYNENGHHLRLRFKLKNRDAGKLLTAFRAALRRSGYDRLVANYETDTYRRELERYGPALIGLAENVFCSGSIAVCEHMNEVKNDGYDHFLFGLFATYQLICCFVEETEKMIGFTEQMASSFMKEFGGGKQLKIDMDLKYRSLRPAVTQMFSEKNHRWTGQLHDLVTTARRLAASAKTTNLTDPLPLLSDVIHMQMNRNFTFEQRQNEFLVYYCLHKYLKSVRARDGQNVQP